MGETHILQVPRSDEDGYILVQVTSNGRKALDLKLVATEGECPYAVELKQARVSSLKDKKHPCSEAEWEKILANVLLDRQSDPEIEAVAHVSVGDSVMLVIRRSISGITQRIGTITLTLNNEEAIELFDWCGNSIGAKKKVRADLASATTRVEELESAVKELKDQLEELIEAKKTDETELLEKFRDLLNEKKVKIREQQRLLIASDGDGASIPKPQPQSRQKSPEPVKGRKPKASRSSKRKAPEPEPEPEPETEPEPEPEAPVPESEDELDKMEVDRKHGEEDSEDDRTTDDEATASEGDDDNDDEPIPDRRHTPREIEKPPAANTRAASRQGQVEAFPPPRKLPFNRGKPAAKPAPSVPAGGSETESDDEL